MAVDALDELLLRIQQLTVQDLRSLAQAQDFGAFSQIRTLQPDAAIQEIYSVLEESSSVNVLVERVGWLYCWLMSRHKFGPWVLFRLGASAIYADCRIVLHNIARVWPINGRPVTVGLRRHHGIYHGCFISNYTGRNATNWEVVLVVFWRGQRFAAVYAGTDDQKQTLLNCLHIVLRGESVELLRGPHANLSVAFRAGCLDSDRPT
ncbi:hypothetical protein MRX96_024262 [Rhipicephalus microplus]